MDHALEVQLLQRCLQHWRDKTTQSSHLMVESPVSRYTDEIRFRQELRLFQEAPLAVAHASQLPVEGFLTLSLFGKPVLLSRDSEGLVHAFFNVCRHRGAVLETGKQGSKTRFRCPYHGWTYASSGDLIAVPHQAEGFPGLDRATRGLRAISCDERHGFIWLQLNGGAIDVDAWLAELKPDMQWMDCANLRVFKSVEKVWNNNWKLFMEGGVESYHFRETHSETIGPYFPDNLSIYDRFGPHFRSVLPKRSISELEQLPESDWDIRQVSNVLYSFLPGMSLLVQPDHIAWINAVPLTVDSAYIAIYTLVPADSPASQDPHWQRNHDIEVQTLMEDFVMAEGIQAGLDSGANESFLLARFEGALQEFNAIIDEKTAAMEAG